MKVLIRQDIFYIPTQLLILIGEFLHRTPKTVYVYRLFNWMVLIYLFVFVVVDFFYIRGGTYLKALESLISVIHTALKYLLISYYKSYLDTILNDRRRKFWIYQEANKQFRVAVESIYKIIKTFQIAMVSITVLLGYMYYLKPLYSDEVFALEAFVHPKLLLVNMVTQICQYYFFWFGAIVILAYDIFYICLCIDVSIQIRYLNRKLVGVSAELDSRNIIRAYLKHHQFLLILFQRMKRIYSTMLIFHYFVTLVTIFADLYGFISRGSISSNIIVILQLMAIAFILSQFACYSFPAEQVAAEFTSLSTGIYMSQWYIYDIRTQKSLLFAMMKSQRVQYFSGIGFVDINIEAFSSVVRKTFSFYTLLRNIF